MGINRCTLLGKDEFNINMQRQSRDKKLKPMFTYKYLVLIGISCFMQANSHNEFSKGQFYCHVHGSSSFFVCFCCDFSRIYSSYNFKFITK